VLCADNNVIEQIRKRGGHDDCPPDSTPPLRGWNWVNALCIPGADAPGYTTSPLRGSELFYIFRGRLSGGSPLARPPGNRRFVTLKRFNRFHEATLKGVSL